MDPDFFLKNRPGARKPWEELCSEYKAKRRKRFFDPVYSKIKNNQSNSKNNDSMLTLINSNNSDYENNNYHLSENVTGDGSRSVASESYDENSKNNISNSESNPLNFKNNYDNISNNNDNINKSKQLDIFTINESIPLVTDVIVNNIENNHNNSSSSSIHNNIISLDSNSADNNFRMDESTEVCNSADNNFRMDESTEVCKQTKLLPIDELLKSRLAKCIVVNKINLTQCTALLNVLRDHPHLKFLPKDSRALLKTPRDKIETKEIPPGEYLHLGLQIMINSMLGHIPPEEIPSELTIDFSTDGVELNKETQLWPIQFRIVNLQSSKPELAGIYKGNSKPNSFVDFFSDFVEEVNGIIKKGGINFNNQKIPIKLRCLVADAPARSYILNHYGHNSQYPCSKCYVKGTSYMGSNRFPGIGYKLRTNDEHRLLLDVDHNKGKSALHDLPIDLIDQVSFDYMHLVCLGVMKKTIESLVIGKCTPVKLPSFKVTILSNRLITLQLYCPREFARIPRELDKLATFKATEFRQILLYTFIVVFRGVISDDQYNHFLLLHASMRILLSDSSSPENIDFADQSLKTYILDAETIHGLKFLTYNAHGTNHLVTDYKLYGPLDSVSAFQYENQMPKYREAVRKPDKPLQQIKKRTLEDVQFPDPYEKKIKKFKALNSHDYGPIPSLMKNESKEYESVQTPSFYFSIQNTDNTILTEDDQIGIIKNIIFYNNEYYFAVHFFADLRPFYVISNRPSTNFGVFLCTSLDDTKVVIIAYPEIKKKCYRMPLWVDKPLTNWKVNDEQLNNAYVAVTL